MSARITLAPLDMNLVAASLPMPLAAPVIRATFPSSFLDFWGQDSRNSRC